MKKFMFLVIGASIALTTVSSQTPQTTTPTTKAAEKDMRKDVIELKEGRKERNKKIARVQFKKAGKVQKEINVDRKQLNANKKHLKNKGKKDPVRKAKDQVGQ